MVRPSRLVLMVCMLAASAAALAGDAPSSATTKLGVQLYGKLRANKGNLVISPASARTALAVARAGAGGKTKAQLDKVVGDDAPAGSTAVIIGSGISAVADAFRKDVAALHGVVVVAGAKLPSEFSAMGSADLSKSVPADGVTILNVLSFKGTWQTAFDDKLTSDVAFYVDGKTDKTVSMMHKHALLSAARLADVDVVDLPYQDGGSLLVAIPRTRTGLAAVEQALADGTVAHWTSKLRPQEVELTLPRFHAESATSLTKALAGRMPNAFCDQKATDFSRLGTADGPLCIEDILHAAVVDVDEHGTTAAASTMVHLVMAEGEPEHPKILDIKADHPFLFFLKDAAGAVTFLGRVNDPTQGSTPTSTPTPTVPSAPSTKR